MTFETIVIFDSSDLIIESKKKEIQDVSIHDINTSTRLVRDASYIAYKEFDKVKFLKVKHILVQ